MTPGIYSTVSALTARWSEQEKSAENLSGANTVAHKRQVVGYGSFDNVLHSSTSLSTTAQPLPYAQAAVSDWTNGPMEANRQQTRRSDQRQWLLPDTSTSRIRLTRDGHFSVNSAKQLVNDAGYPVLGTRGPITISGNDVQLAADGKVLANGKPIDQLDIVTVDHPEKLQTSGGGLFAAGNASTKPFNGTIAPGNLEMSNVDVPTEMASMIQNQRMYDMLTRAFQAQDEGIGKAIQDLSGS